MSIGTVAVIGSGTMGRGIAQSAALAGRQVILYDVAEDVLDKGLRAIRHSIDEGVQRGKTTREAAERAKGAITPAVELHEAARVDLVIEAVVGHHFDAGVRLPVTVYAPFTLFMAGGIP